MTDQAHPTYRFWGRTPPKSEQRTPILAAAPTPKVDESGTATLRLYDPIDDWGEFWGVSSKEFAAALDEVKDATEIRLLVNCPGGMVYEGFAIMNLLRNHPAKVVAVVEGIAASAASFIVASADEVVMNRNTELMIHDAWGVCVGPAADMRDLATRLDSLSNNIASVYVDKAGGSVDGWREAMLAETWYSADEAVAAGLADRVGTDATTSGAAADRFDLSVFSYAGRGKAPPPPKAPPAAHGSREAAAALAQRPAPAPSGDTHATIDNERLAQLLTANPYDAVKERA